MRRKTVPVAIFSLCLTHCFHWKKKVGWGTWIRTRTNGVRVRGSTVNLFPNEADVQFGRDAVSNNAAGARLVTGAQK